MAYNVRLLLQRIEENLATRPRTSLSEIARQLNVERHTIERSVRSGTGRTFRELQDENLLVQALRLLTEEPGRSLKEVSFELGYSSPRAFRRFIKQAWGTSPKEARLILNGAGAPSAVRKASSRVTRGTPSSQASSRKRARTVP
jgi:AraC-like DNA-binding protein